MIKLTNEFCGLVDKAVDRAFAIKLQNEEPTDEVPYIDMLSAVYEELVGNSCGRMHGSMMRRMLLVVERQKSSKQLYELCPVLDEGTEETATLLLSAIQQAFLEEHYSELLETFWDKEL